MNVDNGQGIGRLRRQGGGGGDRPAQSMAPSVSAAPIALAISALATAARRGAVGAEGAAFALLPPLRSTRSALRHRRVGPSTGTLDAFAFPGRVRAAWRPSLSLSLARGPSGEYLDHLSSESGDEDEVNMTENGDDSDASVPVEEHDDDDYAMSVPKPVRSASADGVVNTNGDGDGTVEISSSSTLDGEPSVHPNEEPPVGYDRAAAAPNIYNDAVKNSKFEEPGMEVLASSEVEAAADKTDEEDNKSGAGVNTGLVSFLQNLMGRDNLDEDEEEAVRRLMWREWMTTGRKMQYLEPSEASSMSSLSPPPPPSSDVALDALLPALDKGDDYVVVAVPAEVADGVGPVLPSFPGGKLFQKNVGSMLANGDVTGNSTTVTSATAAVTSKKDARKKTMDEKKKIAEERKKNAEEKKKKAQEERMKKREQLRKKKEKAKKTLLDSKKLREEEETERKKRRRRMRNARAMRDPGRISASDWAHNVKNIPMSTILRDVLSPVAWVFAWSTLWSVAYHFLGKAASEVAASGGGMRGWATAVWIGRHMTLPTTQHTMMVSAMSLLMVFRTNSAYQRFAEGRKIWNDIVDTTRDFSRMLKLYEYAIGTSKCRRIKNLLASFPYLLRHRIRPSLMTFYRVDDQDYVRDPDNSLLLYPDESLRDTDPDAAALAYDEEETGSSRRKPRELCWVDRRTLPWRLLPGSALELCARAQNRPLWVCDRMAKELAVVEDVLPTFTNRERLAIIGFVDKLSRSIGACERIHQTAVPLNYARHALRSLTVWLWTLPFVLVKDLGLLTGPAVAVISWVLFGVYEIGTRIEDPFQGTLRLSIYCDAIRRDVLADAIARDTAFNLDDGGKSSVGEEGDYDAILELESESEEYDGEGNTSSESKKKQKKVDFLGSLGFS